MSKLSTRLIIATTAALSYFAFVQAAEEHCGVETETIIIQPEMQTYRIIPGEYKWVEGEQPGYAFKYRVEPAKFTTVKDADVIQAPKSEYIGNGRAQVKFIPAVTKPFARKTLTEAAYPVARSVPNEIKDGRTKVQTKRPTFEEVTIPAQTKTITRMKTCQIASSTRSGK